MKDLSSSVAGWRHFNQWRPVLLLLRVLPPHALELISCSHALTSGHCSRTTSHVTYTLYQQEGFEPALKWGECSPPSMKLEDGSRGGGAWILKALPSVVLLETLKPQVSNASNILGLNNDGFWFTAMLLLTNIPIFMLPSVFSLPDLLCSGCLYL